MKIGGGLAMVLSTGLLLTACGDNQSQSPIAQPFELNILHINDSHSHLDEAKTQLPLLVDETNREAIQLSYAGFPRVTALMNSRAQQLSNVIKIHAGDAIVGDLYYRMAKGEAEAALMNTVCFDSFTLGNHEFDHGDSELKRFLDFLTQKHSCTQATEILSSNVVFGKNSALFNDPRIKPYSIIERANEKIGLIGVTAAKKTKGSSRPDVETDFTDEVKAVQKAIDDLAAQGINKIVLQSHIGYAEDLALVKQLKGVDVVIGGDSHSLLAPSHIERYGLAAQADYPTQIQDANGNAVCVAQAWQYAAVVGELNVQFDANGEVTACHGRPHLLVADDFERVDGQILTDSQRDYIKQDLTNSQIFSIVQPDPNALAVLEPYRVAKTLFGQQQVAWAEENLCLRRVPGRVRDIYRSALGEVCNQNEFNHAHGGDIQQLVAEAFLQQGKKYFNADVALINGGGVREDLALGNINVDQIYRVLAFKNTLEQLSMTGNELKMMLEDAMQAVLAGHTGSYPYTAGLRWQVDLNQPFGHRVSQLEILQQGMWHTLQQTSMYQLITIDFLADGQGGFDTLKNITGKRRVNVGLDYTEAFLQYLEDLPEQNGQKILRRLPLDLYSTQYYVETSK